MARKAKKRQWPNVYSRTHRSGQASNVVDLGLVNGKWERHSFDDKASANTFAEQKRTERLNEGTAALGLSQESRAGAAKAEKLLKSRGVSMEKAAKYYVKHVIAYRNAPTVDEIIDKMVAEAEQKNRRDRTILDLKNRCKVFSGNFPDTRLSEITLDEVKEWFAEADDWAPIPSTSTTAKRSFDKSFTADSGSTVASVALSIAEINRLKFSARTRVSS